MVADGSHLTTECPNGGAQAIKQYYNFEGFSSTVLMALVNAEYRFIWASVGARGNKHDSTLLQSTDLWKRIVGGEMIPNLHHEDGILPDDKRYFIYRHSRARLVTEGAFGTLKMRFRVLLIRDNKETVKLYGLACVVLRNLCIERGDLVPRKFNITSEHASNKHLSPEEVRNVL